MKTRLLQHLSARFAQAPYRGCRGFLVSVSGGVDSMVLLDAVLRLAHVHRAAVRVFHCDHGTGRFAACSRQLVADFCAAHELSLLVAAFDAADGPDFEYRAAVFRREQLARALGEGEVVLLAHHAGDQMETMLMALTRGAVAASPLGMAAAKNRRLRPLLDVDRGIILEHAAAAEVPHVLDGSNYDGRFRRNHLRHQVIPLLAEGHEKPWLRWQRWHASFAELQDQLDAAAEPLLAAYQSVGPGGLPLLQREWWSACPPYLREFVLRRFWRDLGLAPPIHAHHRQLVQWLDAGELGTFQHEDGTVHCDLDGLTWWPAPATVDGCVAWGEPFRLGPWVCRLARPRRQADDQGPKPKQAGLRTMALLRGRAVADLPPVPPSWRDLWAVRLQQTETLFLSAPTARTPQLRDWLRREKIPHRVRRLLPCLRLTPEGEALPLEAYLAMFPESVQLEPGRLP